MKKIILLVLLTGLVGCAENKNSSSVASKNHDKELYETCKVIDGLSRAIMEGRQTGTAMVDSINIAEQSDDPELRGLAISITKAAYAIPRYNTNENQQKAINDFRNEMYQACLTKN